MICDVSNGSAVAKVDSVSLSMQVSGSCCKEEDLCSREEGVQQAQERIRVIAAVCSAYAWLFKGVEQKEGQR